MRSSRIAAPVMGCLLVIPAIALPFGGGALGLGYAFGRGDDGYLDTTLDRLETVAITADDINVSTEPGSPDRVLEVAGHTDPVRGTSAGAGSRRDGR